MLRSLSIRCVVLLGLLGLPLLTLGAQASKNILVFGDSLSAGYGIRHETSWPSLLQERLKERKFDYSVINASISGETSSGGQTRLPMALKKYTPRIVVIALGANDGLRGLPISTLHANLQAMIASAKKINAQVLVVGQRLPPNYGQYADEFHDVFGRVAKAQKVALVDFLLEGVALNPRLFQADNLHPTAAAQPQLLDNVWRGLEPLLR